jgi:hypothetical protein
LNFEPQNHPNSMGKWKMLVLPVKMSFFSPETTTVWSGKSLELKEQSWDLTKGMLGKGAPFRSFWWDFKNNNIIWRSNNDIQPAEVRIQTLWKNIPRHTRHARPRQLECVDLSQNDLSNDVGAIFPQGGLACRVNLDCRVAVICSCSKKSKVKVWDKK